MGTLAETLRLHTAWLLLPDKERIPGGRCHHQNVSVKSSSPSEAVRDKANLLTRGVIKVKGKLESVKALSPKAASSGSDETEYCHLRQYSIVRVAIE